MNQHPIKTYMRPFPYSIDAGASLCDAVEMMREEGIRHLPVKRNGKLWSVISKRELSEAMLQGENRSLEMIGNNEPYIVDLHSPLGDVVREMGRRHIGSVLVTRGSDLAGIMTSSDICRILGDLLEEMDGEDDTPDEIA